MEPYSRNLAKPFSAWRLVMAAVRVVYAGSVSGARSSAAARVPFRGRRGQWCLGSVSMAPTCRLPSTQRTNVDVRLVTRESRIAADAVEPATGSVGAEGRLHGADAALALQGGARGAQQDAGQGRHGAMGEAGAGAEQSRARSSSWL